MLRRTVFSSIILLAVLNTNVWGGTYSGGAGEPNNPYRIATPEDLNDIGNHVEDFNKCFVMVNDINLAQFTGTEFNIIGPNSTTPFTGVFDGNGHTIANFTYSSTGTNFVGLFGRVDDANAVIKDLTFDEVQTIFERIPVPDEHKQGFTTLRHQLAAIGVRVDETEDIF